MMTEAPDVQRLLQLAVEFGAEEARIIDARSVVTAAWVRIKCQYGCGGYNARLTCPPYTPTPEQMQKVLDGYSRGILVHCTGQVRPTAVVSKLEREAFISGYYKALGLGEGPCRLCETCNTAHCAHPREARPSMEACGIDVYATVRANGLPIRTLPDRSCPYNLYGLVLLE